MVLSLAVEEVIIFRPETPAELQLRQGLAWHTRRLTKPGRVTMLGPITRPKTGRSRYRMSQPEPLVRRFNITSLLRNHHANAPGAPANFLGRFAGSGYVEVWMALKRKLACKNHALAVATLEVFLTARRPLLI